MIYIKQNNQAFISGIILNYHNEQINIRQFLILLLMLPMI